MGQPRSFGFPELFVGGLHSHVVSALDSGILTAISGHCYPGWWSACASAELSSCSSFGLQLPKPNFFLWSQIGILCPGFGSDESVTIIGICKGHLGPLLWSLPWFLLCWLISSETLSNRHKPLLWHVPCVAFWDPLPHPLHSKIFPGRAFAF